MEIIIGLIILFVIYKVFSKPNKRKNEVTLRVEVSGPGDYRSDSGLSSRPSGTCTWNGKAHFAGNENPGRRGCERQSNAIEKSALQEPRRAATGAGTGAAGA